MNIFNVALITRAFLFFAYPTAMSGDACWVAKESICGLGNDLPDTFTMATPLGEAGYRYGTGFLLRPGYRFDSRFYR